MEHMSKLKIEHDDVLTKFFLRSLRDDAWVWFENLPRGEISSFACFVQEFREYWDLSYEKGSDP